MPAWARISIGAAVLTSYWSYVLLLGRRAFLAGERGDLRREDAGYTEIAA